MAQRRMFSKKITDTDLFLDMPMSAQCLYFHLNMAADDDGFIGNAKTIRRMVGASEDDFKLLMAKEFIIPFESGVVVIKDWKVHNYIRSDRYNETVYKEEKEQLTQNENGQYELGMTFGIPDGNQMDTQVRLGKVRLGKDSVVKVNNYQKRRTSQCDTNAKFIANEKKDKKRLEVDKVTLLPESYQNVNQSIEKEFKDKSIELDVVRSKNNDNDKYNPFTFYQENGFGTIAPLIRDKIVAIHNDFKAIGSSSSDADQLIIKALEMAVIRNIRNWAYAEKILINWNNKGFKTVMDVDASEKQFQASKNRGTHTFISEEASKTTEELLENSRKRLAADVANTSEEDFSLFR